MTQKILICSFLFFVIACSENRKEKENNNDTIFVHYNNGSIKNVKILNHGEQIVDKFFDKNGVLLNEDFNGNKRRVISYYRDTLVYEESFYTMFDRPREDGAIAINDSSFFYSHEPNELILKYIVKDHKYIITYFENNIPRGYDTIRTDRKLIGGIINKVLGKDTLIEGYIPDVKE